MRSRQTPAPCVERFTIGKRRVRLERDCETSPLYSRHMSPLHPAPAPPHPRGAGRLARILGQIALGGVLVTAGVGHLTSQREEFQAQVPSWVPLDADLVVVASGVVEIGLGASL